MLSTSRLGTNYFATQTTYTLRSSKTQIAIPSVFDTSFTYTGGTLAPTIIDAPPTSAVAYSGTMSAKAAGNYTFSFALRDTSAYEWANGSTATLSFSWSIAKLTFVKPRSRTAAWSVYAMSVPGENYDSEFMNCSGEKVAKDLVTYTATVSLKDKSSTCWKDGSTDDITVTLTIVKRAITVSGNYDSLATEYNGRAIDITQPLKIGIIRDNFSDVFDYVTLGGILSATEIGTYKATVDLGRVGKV